MAPRSTQALTRAEWKIMRIAWGRKSFLARDVYEEARPKHNWAISTVKTLLRRLVDKGHLKATRVGKSFLYRPRRSALKSLIAAADHLIESALSGMAGPLVMHLVKSSDLSPEEIAQLRSLLDKHRQQTEGNNR